MFWCIILPLSAVGAWYFWNQSNKYSDDRMIGLRGLSCGLGFIVFTTFISVSGNMYFQQLDNVEGLRGNLRGIQVSEARRDKLVAVVKEELSKYPEIEQKVLANLNPQFILSFPQLKSNETISKTVDDIVKLNDSVYSSQYQLIALCTKIRKTNRNVMYFQPFHVGYDSKLCKDYQ